MSDRSLIDRELERVELRPFTIQTFHRRREQKRRRRRIAAGVVGVAVGLIAVLIGSSIVRSIPTPASPHPVSPREVQLTYSDGSRIDAVNLATGRRRVFAPNLSVSAFAWSPDGRAFVYESRSEQCSVVIHNVDTRGDHVLADCGSLAHYRGGVDWSADGTWIAFSRPSSDGPGDIGSHIVLIHPNGTGQTLLTDPDGVPVDAGTPSLSPDGSAVVFEAGREIHIMNVDGTGRRFLASGMWPDWSADGSTIAFARDPYLPLSERGHGDPFVWQYWSIRPDGAGLTKLHGWKHCCIGGWATGPMWSPDGSQIAGVALNRLHVIDADGRGARTITGVTISSGSIAWRSLP
jgi:Tol biopolymer transport system component